MEAGYSSDRWMGQVNCWMAAGLTGGLCSGHHNAIKFVPDHITQITTKAQQSRPSLVVCYLRLGRTSEPEPGTGEHYDPSRAAIVVESDEDNNVDNGDDDNKDNDDNVVRYVPCHNDCNETREREA